LKAIGPAADVYSLGAILYEMLTGRPPFQGESELDTLQQVQFEDAISPSRLRSRLPADLETICLKCLQKEQARRYPSAAALAEDLHSFLAGDPIRARPVQLPERFFRWCRRKPALAAASALGVFALLGVLFSAISYSFAVQRARASDLLRQEHEQTQEALREA